MVILNQNTENTFPITASLNVTISNPVYLFEFQHKLTNEFWYIIPYKVPTSYTKPSYDEFIMNVNFSQVEQLTGNTQTTANLHLIPGEYLIKVYQQTSNSNLDPLLSSGEIYQIMGKVNESTEVCVPETPYQGDDDEWIVYDECLPTPAVDVSPTPTPSITPSNTPTTTLTATPTPTPSITASQTPTPPPPSNTPTITPTNTQTQTPTSSLTPTPTLTPYLQFCIDAGFDYATEGVLISTGNTLYVYGSMEFYDNNAINKIARLNQTSGLLDNSFVPGFPDSVDYVYSVVEASNGDLYAAGTFTNFAGEVRQGIVKMTNTGQEVLTFDSGSGFNNTVSSMVLDEANNALYVAGQFTTYNGTGANRLVKLDATTGAIDTTFSTGFGTGFNNSAYDLLLDGLGGLYVGGAFTQFQGAANARIIKLDANAGTKDTSFVNTTGASSSVYNIHSDGADLYLTGNFSSVRGVSSPRVCKISTLGVVDASYAGTGANTSINASHLDSFGRLIIAAPSFLTWQGTSVNGLARLNTDGTLDTTFVSNNGASFSLGYGHSFQGNDSPITTDAFGNIYITGDFGSFDGIALNNFVKLDSDGFLITINDCGYPLITPTPTNSPTASITPSNTQTPTVTPTNTSTPTNTPTNTETPTPTNTATNTPTNTGTPTPTPTLPRCSTFRMDPDPIASWQYRRCDGTLIERFGETTTYEECLLNGGVAGQTINLLSGTLQITNLGPCS